jgi:ribosomal protein S25
MASYLCSVGGALILLLPFPFLQSFHHLAEAAIEIGLVGVILLVLLPWLWRQRAHLFRNGWSYIKLIERTLHQWRTKPIVPQPLARTDKSGKVFFLKKQPQENRSFENTAAVNQGPVTPITLLPVNPKKSASSTLKPKDAAYLIGNALCLAGITNDSLSVEIIAIESGPTLQTVTFKLPAKVQLSQLMKKREDLANHLGFHQGFDVLSGVEQSSAAFVIPHRERAFVYLRDGIEHPQFPYFASKAKLPFIMGMEMVGDPKFLDLAKLPHVLIAGTTGSGKSVCINAILGALLCYRGPDEMKLLLIDPKMVELSIYKGFPHLLLPPVTDMKRATLALKKVVVEMEQRYEQFAKEGVRDIDGYNRGKKHKMPYIVIVVDEYADLMIVAQAEVEEAVQRITQLARAAGIHLILGTQRPSVDVVTGVIKSNLPSRVSFRLSSSSDYRTVMERGCPSLLGYGDGVMMLNDGSFTRFQSAAISVDKDEEAEFIEQLKEYWNQVTPTHQSEKMEMDLEDESLPPRKVVGQTIKSTPSEPLEPFQKIENEELTPVQEEDQEEEIEGAEELTEELYQEAIETIFRNKKAHVFQLQNELHISYFTAQKVLDRMEAEGIVGPANGYQPRTILVSKSSLTAIKTDEEILNEMKYQICFTQTARINDLRDSLGIRKEKLLYFMQQLVQEGFLIPPVNPRAGYQIAWTEEEIQSFLKQ